MTFQKRWTIEKDSKGKSGKSVLAARHDDDDDTHTHTHTHTHIYIYIYIYIYIFKTVLLNIFYYIMNHLYENERLTHNSLNFMIINSMFSCLLF